MEKKRTRTSNILLVCATAIFLVVLGILSVTAPACTTIQGDLVLTEGKVKGHYGNSVGLNIDTKTHVGLGFNEGYTDYELAGTGSFTKQAMASHDPVE